MYIQTIHRCRSDMHDICIYISFDRIFLRFWRIGRSNMVKHMGKYGDGDTIFINPKPPHGVVFLVKEHVDGTFYAVNNDDCY